MSGLDAGRVRLTTARPLLRSAAAWGFGVLAALALPPLYLVFLLVPAFVGVVWLAHAAEKPRGAFWAGWWFGFGYFSAGLYWISFALLVEADKFGWLIPIAIVGLGGGFALFPALVAYGARRVGGVAADRVGFVLAFAALWMVSEWLRSWIFTGFPWNLLGSVWAFSDAALQPVAWVGTFGLSLLTVLAASIPAALAGGGRRGVRAVVGVYVVLALALTAGWLRLPADPTALVDGVRLRLVQPAIAQKKKWQPDLRWAHVVDQVSLSAREPLTGPLAPTHVIWAETAAPMALEHEAVARGVIGANTPKGGLSLIGTVRTTPRGVKPFQVWNSLQAVDNAGEVVATYDKFHLVPFGEYMPFGELLGLKKITAGRADFSAGTGPQTLRLPGLPPLSPLICYEIIFPGAVIDRADRPDWMLNVTNDGWYGLTPGPHQHFVTARLRAVEEGLPVVRVANTGISGVIDGYGRVIARLGLGQRGIIDSGLPRPLAAPGLYGQGGNAIPLGLALMVSTIAGVLLRRRP